MNEVVMAKIGGMHMFLTQKDIMNLIINEDFRYLSPERQQEIFRKVRNRLISYYENTEDNLINKLNIKKNTNFTVETSLLLIVILETYGQKFLQNWILGKRLSEDQKNEWIEKSKEILNWISSSNWKSKDSKGEDKEKDKKKSPLEEMRIKFKFKILLLERKENYIFSKVENTIFNLILGKFESDEIESMKNQLEKMVRLFEHLTEDGQVEFIKKKKASVTKMNHFLLEVLEQEIKEYKNFRIDNEGSSRI